MRVFAGRVTGGDPAVHDWESLDVRWFPLDALPEPLFRFSREHIEDACANAEEPFEKEQQFSRLQAVLWSCFLVYRRLRNAIRRRPQQRKGA
jgi:hypothetical protein